MRLPLFPEQASNFAPETDHLLYFLLAVAVFFTVLIFGAIFYFAIRYRRRSDRELPRVLHTGLALEIVWSVIPFGLTMIMFGWGADLFFRESRPPTNALQIYVVGKQWMWKLQHMEGQREINELHVPVGVPVKITLTSQDVIHDFFVPAFRVKKDALPGRYTSLWFDPTEVGKYHLFCAQYCGTNHGDMTGWIYVMSPKDYAAWLANGEKTESMAQQGEHLFTQYGCIECHVASGSGRGPSLVGLYGQPEKLASGEMRVVDETLIRQAILVPNSVHVPSYQPIMPTYQGQLTEEQILDLIAYVKSLGSQERNGK